MLLAQDSMERKKHGLLVPPSRKNFMINIPSSMLSPKEFYYYVNHTKRLCPLCSFLKLVTLAVRRLQRLSIAVITMSFSLFQR